MPNYPIFYNYTHLSMKGTGLRENLKGQYMEKLLKPNNSEGL